MPYSHRIVPADDRRRCRSAPAPLSCGTRPAAGTWGQLTAPYRSPLKPPSRPLLPPAVQGIRRHPVQRGSESEEGSPAGAAGAGGHVAFELTGSVRRVGKCQTTEPNPGLWLRSSNGTGIYNVAVQ